MSINKNEYLHDLLNNLETNFAEAHFDGIKNLEEKLLPVINNFAKTIIADPTENQQIREYRFIINLIKIIQQYDLAYDRYAYQQIENMCTEKLIKF